MNCNNDIGWEKIAEHLSFFMARMQNAGYDQQFRLQVLKSAINAYEEKKKRHADGEVPFYRNRQWKKNERRKEKEKKRNDWYKKGGTESVLFISATPNSELKNQLQKEINKTSFKIRVIEKSGTKLVKLLQRNDPFKKKECRNKEECMICSGSNPGGCRDSGVTYRIECLGNQTDNPEVQCGGEYKGETGKNGYTRGSKHAEEYEKKYESSVLWKHCLAKHGGQKQKFEMTVENRSRNDPTKRQVLEAVMIQKVPAELTMNSKSEWNSARVPRARVSTDN